LIIRFKKPFGPKDGYLLHEVLHEESRKQEGENGYVLCKVVVTIKNCF